MKKHYVKVSLLTVFVFLAALLSGTAFAAAPAAGAAASQAGSAAGVGATAGITTGTIVTGAVVAAVAAAAIVSSGGQGDATAVNPTNNATKNLAGTAAGDAVNAAEHTLAAAERTALSAANTALGTSGQTALAQTAAALNTTEFTSVSSALGTLNQATVSNLAAASTASGLGTSYSGMTAATAFSGVTAADAQAAMTALAADGYGPLAAPSSAAAARLYNYLKGLRDAANVAGAPAGLRASFNGLYNAVDANKSNTTSIGTIVSYVTTVTATNIVTAGSLLSTVAASTTVFSATQSLFTQLNTAGEIAAVKNLFGATVTNGVVNTTTLANVVTAIYVSPTMTAQQIAEQDAVNQQIILTAKHPGYTVIVTAVQHGTIWTTSVHMKKI